MRTTVIPAQITTVEDTIAGNLNFTQIVLLVSSLFVNTFVYALIPQAMKLSIPKMILITMIFAIFILLSFRIKGRIILHWLTILASYTLRPHIYVFSKNSLFVREIDVPKHTPTKNKVTAKNITKGVEKLVTKNFDYETLVRNTNVNLRFKRKGILVVKNYD